MLIDIGPATLVIKGEKNGMAYAFDRAQLVARVEAILADIRDCLPVLKQKAYKIRRTAYLPEVARKMVDAVKVVDESTLTPMAAVAGSVADELKEYLKGAGLEFVSVNNGGDIAIVNKRPKPVTIGIGDAQRSISTPYILRIGELVNFGVATSGFGGRSFTLGLADIVSVVAPSAPLADAAATFVCNNTNVDAAGIVRRKAAEIDPSTDIFEEMVTVSIGNLPRARVVEALERGKAVAERLKREGSISEAVIFLKGDMVTTVKNDRNIRLEVARGN